MVSGYPDRKYPESPKRLHVSRYPELLYDTHAQCGSNMICSGVSTVTASCSAVSFGTFCHSPKRNNLPSSSACHTGKFTPSKETFYWKAGSLTFAFSNRQIEETKGRACRELEVLLSICRKPTFDDKVKIIENKNRKAPGSEQTSQVNSRLEFFFFFAMEVDPKAIRISGHPVYT